MTAFAAFLEHYLKYDPKGNLRIKRIERPQGTLNSICTAINAAYHGASMPSPAENPLITRQIQQIIQQETKRPKKDKGIIAIPQLLSFLLQSSGYGEEEKLRLLLILVMGFVRIARLSDLWRLDRDSIKFSDSVSPVNSRKVTLYSLGEKTDKTRRGHPVTLVRCADARVCPIRLLHTYLLKTENQAEMLCSQRSQRDRSPIPLFYYLDQEPKPIAQKFIEAEIKKLLKEAGMTEDSTGRHITPGCIRISARDAALKAGFHEDLVSAIGHWALQSTQARHYTPYDMPEEWTDKILQPNLIE